MLQIYGFDEKNPVSTVFCQIPNGFRQNFVGSLRNFAQFLSESCQNSNIYLSKNIQKYPLKSKRKNAPKSKKNGKNRSEAIKDTFSFNRPKTVDFCIKRKHFKRKRSFYRHHKSRPFPKHIRWKKSAYVFGILVEIWLQNGVLK